MSLQPSEEPYTTIARLHAEVEQLKCDLTHEVGFRERAERERDEVRAEVEHLQLIEASWIALKSVIGSGPVSSKPPHLIGDRPSWASTFQPDTPGGDLWPRAERVEEAITKYFALNEFPTEARALLDRLQRAEAVVEAAQYYQRENSRHRHSDPECSAACLPFQRAENRFREALAAWEEYS